MTNHPARITSADQLPAAIAWAGENPDYRWYVTKLARAYKREDLLPEEWGQVGDERAPERRIVSDQDHYNTAVINDELQHTPKPEPESGGADEAVTAALGRKRKTQKVQTEAGVKRYNAPIGTPIVLKNGKLVADLHAAVRLDDNNAVISPRRPVNRIAPTRIDDIEEGDEIRTKDDVDHVVISNTKDSGGHTLITADAEGKRHQFALPPGRKVRLIEDADAPGDDDEDTDVPDRTTPDEVAANQAAYLAAKRGRGRGQTGVDAKTVESARTKLEQSREVLDRQIVPPGEAMAPAKRKPELVSKVKRSKLNEQKSAAKPVADKPAPDKPAAPKKNPEADVPANPSEAKLDLSGMKDNGGNPLEAGKPYRIGRGGKQWRIESVTDDGKLNLTAIDGKPGERNSRYKVDPRKLRDFAPPAAETEKPAEPEKLTDDALAKLGKNARRQPLTVDGVYKIGTGRGTQQWRIESIDKRGRLTLAPANGGPRRRHNIPPSKLIPVTGDDAPQTRASRISDMESRLEASRSEPKPDPAVLREGAREAAAQDAAALDRMEEQYVAANYGVSNANARGGDVSEATRAQMRAEKAYLVARRDYAASRAEAEKLGVVDIPRPEGAQPLYVRNADNQRRLISHMDDIELAQERTNSDERLRYIATQISRTPLRNERDGHLRLLEAIDAEQKKRGTYVEPVPEPPREEPRGRTTDAAYLEGLSNDELDIEYRAARYNGIPEVIAAVDEEDRRRFWDEMADLPGTNFYALTDEQIEARIKRGTDDEATMNALIDELQSRDDDDSTSAAVLRRIEAGENPWIVESELTGVDVENIHRREMLRVLNDLYPSTNGKTYTQALDEAYKMELREEINRASEVGGFSSYFNNAAERRFGVAGSDILWTQNEATARANASHELREYWDTHGRLTKKLFRERLLARIGAEGSGTGSYIGSSNGDFLQ